MTPPSFVPSTVDEYILGFPEGVQAILRRVREVVRSAAPSAEEIISYRMPALRQHGVLVYYAAFKGHIGFYPRFGVTLRSSARQHRSQAKKATCDSRSSNRSPMRSLAG